MVPHASVRIASLLRRTLFLTFAAPAFAAGALTITLKESAPPKTDGFSMGTALAPNGSTLEITSQSLMRDGKPWMPVMGEFHYARYPESEWRTELLKMKAGGIDVVATYVFWIHHEEVDGQWDWRGRRDLRRFIETCREVGLLAAVRCGPWCHGEVRNGGLPDWTLNQGWKVRSDDPAYLKRVRKLYEEIAGQLQGLLWRDGGPVIAVQLENEYGGPAEHLLTLKRIAREAGLDVPLYTRTGWPRLATPMPFGEIAPLFGAYAEGFWDRELTSMPGKYWAAFQFSAVRTDAAIANDQLGERLAQDEADAHRYPYLTCELGGGMISSYHRRIAIDPVDVETVALVKVGSGGVMPGYYMYHGGTNPAGLRTTLMESQETPLTNWNDMPVKSYDFFAPLGEYGQVRPHYHALRRLHLFVHDFGTALATWPVSLPDVLPGGREDLSTPRWSVRSNGARGFLFVSNHQRGVTLPAKVNVRFSVQPSRGDALVIPSRAITIPTGARFIWPFNLDVGHGVTLASATAQPVCFVDDGPVRTLFLAATPGIAVELSVSARGGTQAWADITPSRGVAAAMDGDGGRILFVVLDESDSLALWKGTWHGRERVVLSKADLTFDGPRLHLASDSVAALQACVFPALTSSSDGVFQKIHAVRPSVATPVAEVEQIREAGSARSIPLGAIEKPVAAAPKDTGFAEAAAWRIRVPVPLVGAADTLLRLRYHGDVARVMIGDRFITDDFYNGRPLEIGLARHAAELARTGGELRLLVLPLRRDAPIFLPAGAWPQAPGEPPVARLDAAELIPIYSVELTPLH